MYVVAIHPIKVLSFQTFNTCRYSQYHFNAYSLFSCYSLSPQTQVVFQTLAEMINNLLYLLRLTCILPCQEQLVLGIQGHLPSSEYNGPNSTSFSLVCILLQSLGLLVHCRLTLSILLDCPCYLPASGDSLALQVLEYSVYWSGDQYCFKIKSRLKV